MPKRSGRRAWLREHFADPYVQEARRRGHRSRGLAKLREIDSRDGLLAPGMTVVDLGAAPGGWSQYCAERVAPKGRVIALDVLPIKPLAGVETLTADFTEDQGLGALRDSLNGAAVDLVLSDMAPNITGQRAVDQPRMMVLAELALELADETLRPGGALLIKAFQGVGFDEYLGTLRRRFEQVKSRKPEASRGRSREMYLLARGKRT